MQLHGFDKCPPCLQATLLGGYLAAGFLAGLLGRMVGQRFWGGPATALGRKLADTLGWVIGLPGKKG